MKFYCRETDYWYDTDDPDFMWIDCDFCKKSFPSEDGSAFCVGSLYEINFDEKVSCDDCLKDSVDDAWLEEMWS